MQLKNKFLPEETFKQSFVKNCSLTIGIIIIASVFLRVTLTNLELKRLIVPLIVGFFCLYISHEARVKGLLKSHSYMLLIGFTGIAINGALVNGGFRAPVVAAVFLLPLIGVILLGHKGGLIGLGLNLLACLTIFFLEKFNFVTPYNGAHANVFYPIVYLTISIVAFNVVWAMQKAKQESDELITKMYNEIILKAQISSLVKLSEGMSHEINNPLAVISMRTQKLKENLNLVSIENPEDLAKIRQNLDKIQNSTERITKVVSSLFQFSHSSEDEHMEQHHLNDVINTALETVAFRGAAKKIQFDYNDTKNFKVDIKKGQLIQVIANLLNNAIDALDGADNKLIQIKAYEENSKIYISVTDSGPGIPKEFQDKVLLPFFTTKEIGKGSGMGLSISLGIMQAMGGDLWLDKTSEHSKFVIELPGFQAQTQALSA